MNNSFLTQLWIVCKIWFFAVLTNTLLGTFYLSDFFSRPNAVADLMTIGAVYASIFSFPAMVILLLIINRCIAAKTKGLQLFRIVFISGISLSMAVFLVFWSTVHPLRNTEMGTLLCIAVLAAITGIVTQYKSILQSGSDLQQFPVADR